VPKLAVEGSNSFGLIVILLLARRIKALLQKRSFLTGPKTAYFKSKAFPFEETLFAVYDHLFLVRSFYKADVFSFKENEIFSE
jgi:hypothetical protein